MDVTLRAYHDELPPDELTALLGIQPSHSQLAHPPQPPMWMESQNGWFLEAEDLTTSGHFLHKLDALLLVLGTKSGAIEEARAHGWSFDIWAVFGPDAKSVTFRLASATARQLADLQLDLTVNDWR